MILYYFKKKGVPFTAYSAGCNIVILASNFQRVQIIPGILHGNVQVNCLGIDI